MENLCFLPLVFLFLMLFSYVGYMPLYKIGQVVKYEGRLHKVVKFNKYIKWYRIEQWRTLKRTWASEGELRA